MAGWREQLTALVQHQRSDEFPLVVYKVLPPSGEPWPDGILTSDAIRNF